MTVNTPLQFPFIPEDVERLIVECAAESDRNIALQIVLVCRKFQKWADPIVYRTAALQTTQGCQNFLRTLETSKSPSFFSTHVKILTFQHDIGLHFVTRVTSICTGVVSLAYWGTRIWGKSTAFTHSSPPALRRLSYDMCEFLGMLCLDFSLPILQTLTHLEIISHPEDLPTSPQAWASFTSLIHLSHLSLYSYRSQAAGMVADLVPCFPKNLRVCIVFLDREPRLEELEGLKPLLFGVVDPRLVLGTPHLINSAYEDIFIVRDFTDIFQDWGYPIDGEPNTWERAERIIQARQKNSRSDIFKSSLPS